MTPQMDANHEEVGRGAVRLCLRPPLRWPVSILYLHLIEPSWTSWRSLNILLDHGSLQISTVYRPTWTTSGSQPLPVQLGKVQTHFEPPQGAQTSDTRPSITLITLR